MELSFLDLKEREIINVFDGKKLGRVIDIVFNNESGIVRGIVVPGDKKLFHRADDIFIPIEKIKRIGGDVILVGIQREENFMSSRNKKDSDRNVKIYENYYNRYYSEPQRNFSYQKRHSSKDNHSQQRQNTYRTNRETNNDTKENTYIIPESYIRLKPLDRKKYK